MLSGIRVVEVASHVFVPMAGAVLAEWGAEVIKIEHPETGDPYRGLVTAGLHRTHGGVDINFLAANRGKRSVGLDLKRPEGRAVLSRMLATSDVFVTNFREAARRSLKIDVDDVRADNADLIYVRGTAFGPLGPDAARGGYDAGAYWGRSSMQHILSPVDGRPPVIARPAFGDVVGGLTMAGAVSTALYRRATTGRPTVIDGSLLASGMWQVQADVMNAVIDGSTPPRFGVDRYEAPNPLMLPYRTSDGRFIALQMLAPERHWPDLCKVLGQPEMAADPRFADMEARRRNNRECIEWLERTFASRPFGEWRTVLAGFEGEWAPVQQPHELADDPQVVVNGYLTSVDPGTGVPVPVVPVPVQFDGHPGRVERAPEHGEHTEAVLLDLGWSWSEIEELKANRVLV